MKKELMTEEEWYKKHMHTGKLFGISFAKINEIIQMFNEAGYDINKETDFFEIRLKISGIPR